VLSFKTIPFVRIIIPFLLGIYLGLEFDLAFNAVFLLGALSLILLFINFFLKQPETQSRKGGYLFLCDAFLFFSALYCLHVNDLKNHKDFYGNYVDGKEQVWVGKVIDLPQEKENFFKVRMRVESIREPVKGEVIAYSLEGIADQKPLY
jgi:hypothetical protein